MSTALKRLGISALRGQAFGACLLLALTAVAAPRDEPLGHFGQIVAMSSGDGLEVLINGSSASEVVLGDDVVITVSSDREAYLTAIYLDGHGVATILSPTLDPEEGLLKPGQPMRFPAQGGFEAALPMGLESLLVVTTPQPLPRDFFVRSPSRDIPVLDADLAPLVTRNLLAVAKRLPPGSVVAASATQLVRAPARAEGPEYRAAEIQEHFTRRTRALRRPKLDMHIHFATNETTLDDAARMSLDEVGKALTSHPLESVTFEFEGHTDDIGSAEFNLSLSERRAESARQYLSEKYGISPDRLLTAGFGESRPLLPGTSDYERAMNRRVTLTMHRAATRDGGPQVPDPARLDLSGFAGVGD